MAGIVYNKMKINVSFSGNGVVKDITELKWCKFKNNLLYSVRTAQYRF
jgi:hypothetical protein